MSEKYVCPMEDPSPIGGVTTGRAVLVAKTVIDLSIAAAAILVNSFILCAVGPGLLRRRRGRPSKLLVMSLTAGDALGGFMQLHYHLTQNVCPLAHWLARRPALCILKCLSVVLPGLLSINSLAAIGLDRYLCIVHSLKYQRIMTTRRAWLLIALVWSVSMAGTCSLALHHRWRPPETACVEEVLIDTWHTLSVGLPMNAVDFSVLVVTHLAIRREVARSEALHRVVRGGSAGDHSDIDGGLGGSGGAPPPPGPGTPRQSDSDPVPRLPNAANAQGRRHSSSTVKSARVLMLVVGCYSVAYMPVLFVMTLRMLGVGDEQGLALAFRFTYSLTNLNFVVNPFTYAWKNAPLKADMMALWQRTLRGCCGTEGRDPHRRASTASTAWLPTRQSMQVHQRSAASASSANVATTQT